MATSNTSGPNIITSHIMDFTSKPWDGLIKIVFFLFFQ